MRCRDLHGFANPAILSRHPFLGLHCIEPYCVPGGVRVVSREAPPRQAGPRGDSLRQRMLSGELLPVACILDRIEVQLRKLVRWLREAWNNTPVVGKALILLAILTVVAASVYGAYHFLFGVE
jgi:hypothetical protein